MQSQSDSPVFVVGVLRSGTSLLHSLLNQHPSIALMYECDVWNFPAPLNQMRFQGNWLERQEFYNQALSRHRLIFGGSLHGLESACKPEDLYRVYSDLKGAVLYGEKSPFYCTHLKHLFRRYPGAAFILIWRDPRETFRSIVQAGRTSDFFRRPGMLSRLIFHQEQLIRQAAWLERKGARIHHLNYADLVDHTEEVCRGVCGFLGLEFNPRMLRLADADFSAVNDVPHHAFLRRGVIERQNYKEQLVRQGADATLQRYQTRWTRLQSRWLGNGANSAPHAAPELVELGYHAVVGRVLHACDSCKRAFLEFLPLEWWRTGRQFRKWIVTRPAASSDERRSLGRQFAENRPTILAACLYFGALACIHFESNPHLMFFPLYLLPSAALTLIINRRWGILSAIPAAIIGPVIQCFGDTDYKPPGVLIWNATMRFVIILLIVMLLDRIRLEVASTNGRDPK